MADQTDDAQRVWQRSRILDALELMTANELAPPAPEGNPSDEDFLRVAEQAAHIEDGIFDALKEGYPLELTAVDILEICRAVYRRR